MSQNYRIPITAITVFGASILLAVTVGIVLYLGFDQAVSSTRELRADQADTLISAMEQGLDSNLKPVREQAIWVAKDIHDLTDLVRYDEYIFGALAATPQVAGVAIVTADGQSRRWSRGSREAIAGDESENAKIFEWLNDVKQQRESSWREPVWLDFLVGKTTLLHDTPIRDNNGEFIGVFAQIVTVAELSKFLSVNYAETGVTPFILYDRQFVLAHPMLIKDQYSSEL